MASKAPGLETQEQQVFPRPVTVRYYLEDIHEARVDILAEVPWRYYPITREDVERMWAEAPVIYKILKEAPA